MKTPDQVYEFGLKLITSVLTDETRWNTFIDDPTSLEGYDDLLNELKSLAPEECEQVLTDLRYSEVSAESAEIIVEHLLSDIEQPFSPSCIPSAMLNVGPPPNKPSEP